MKAVVYAKCVLVKSFEVADAIGAEEAALHDLIDGELDGWDLTAENEIVRIEDEYGGVAEEYRTRTPVRGQAVLAKSDGEWNIAYMDVIDGSWRREGGWTIKDPSEWRELPE